MDLPSRDLIISATEINNHHGVGILLHRFFPESGELLTLRSLTVYGGAESFGTGHHELKSSTLTLFETEARLKEILRPYRIRRILCVPYYREDFIHGLLAQNLTGAPLCTYIMDDQNIFSSRVPDYWVDGLLRASSLCLGISPELCAAYQHKYHRDFHLLPPVVESVEPLIPCYWQPEIEATLKVAMIGNVWTADRFNKLRSLLRTVGLQVDWYGNGSAASWLPGTPDEWEKDNIFCLGYLPEEDLVASLASYPCVIVPSGSLDSDDDNVAFSRLSLPSRLIFLHTRTDTPVLLLGSRESSAGRFIEHLGTGLCSAYDEDDLRQKLDQFRNPEVHSRLRQAVRQWSSHLVLPDGGRWLWASLARQAPLPATFHDVFRNRLDDTAWLNTLAHAQPKAVLTVPNSAATLCDSAMRAFAFLRSSHLALLRAEGILPDATEDIELTQLLARLAGYLVKKLFPHGGRILILGSTLPDWVTELPPAFQAWRIHEMAEWEKSGFSSDPIHCVPVLAGETDIRPPCEFDAIISSCWLDQVKSSADHESVSTYLTEHTKQGGVNLHTVTAILHPDYFWTTPAHDHLRRHWKLNDWPGLDEILTTDDLFSMSETAYAKYWQPTSGKPIADFGRPLGLLLFWRNAATAARPSDLAPLASRL